MAETTLEKFKKLLAELFMFDQADLDFGIYRIMNAKRDEITRFLDRDLLPEVREALGNLEQADRAAIEAELAKAIEQAKALGAEPESLPKVRELRAQLEQKADVEGLESEILSDLHDFFRRYYDQGDFLSLRRYKEGVYAIPYEGEEVKLYWANSDQYFIKTTEQFRDYSFTLTDGKRVTFKVAEASTEHNNNQPSNGQERRFLLRDSEPVVEEDGDLAIRFEYRPDPEKRKQVALNAQAVQRILESDASRNWLAGLAAKSPTERNPERTFLEKHLESYTARNTFDYFIHKDLGRFLKRELDFYIKNEVMHLDDIEGETAPRADQYLAKVKAIRYLAHKIIDFLAQIENFQKKLWIKKKFVVETNYCFRLDCVPEDLYAEVAANDAQWNEWVELNAIEETARTEARSGNGAQSAIEFLKAHPALVLDTRHFPTAFTSRLLSAVTDLNEMTDGVLVHAENFQALSLLQTRYRGRVKTITIDPPYNRGGDDFPYKDNYRHSSWLTMMLGRLSLAWPLLTIEGALFSNIDENERDNLQAVLDWVFGRDNRVEELIWAQNTTHSQSPLYSTNHEYVEVYVRNRLAAEQAPDMFREPKPGFSDLMKLVEELNPRYPTIAEVENAIGVLFDRHIEAYKEELHELGLDYDDDTKKEDPWKGIYNYCNAEYRASNDDLVGESDARAKEARLVVWRESDPSAPAQKQAESTRNPDDPNFRFYKPLHPRTKNPCPHPKTGWRWPYSWPDATRDSFEALDRVGRIVWGDDETKIPQYKRFVHDVETNVAKSFFHDYTDGEKQIASLFGVAGLFPTPKPTTLPTRFISQTARNDSTILDFFAGSGTTGHAVINLNRKDEGKRKFVLVESARHFVTVLLPRLKKVIFTPDWKDGKPKRTATQEEVQRAPRIMKVIRLESYEDSLNNLELKRTREQGELLEGHTGLREDYLLHYMLDVESQGSGSLIDLGRFEAPFHYVLNIAAGSAGETKPTNVDLIETFNWLLGLRVKHVDTIRDFRVVQGTNPANEKTLIIWRNTREKSNAELDDFFLKQGYNTRDMEFDLIYVNGDNNLENLKRPDETWKVRLIEEDFKRLMFDVEDV